ncbi:hypothetical protein AMTR_s00004p00259940 [Amborella trichopoda]|uniref:Uncharacterized protein n=1 Tax=Amborella trichopoda TaxID=13333 RepID=W1NF32_AMBTC|nr:hypothetical protein AMTR_s00004p00259940 [Amborella trichopoda]
MRDGMVATDSWENGMMVANGSEGMGKMEIAKLAAKVTEIEQQWWWKRMEGRGGEKRVVELQRRVAKERGELKRLERGMMGRGWGQQGRKNGWQARRFKRGGDDVREAEIGCCIVVAIEREAKREEVAGSCCLESEARGGGCRLEEKVEGRKRGEGSRRQ